MPELNDHELLAEFARTESEAAFAALVARHVNLVYSTALRFTGNSHHAEEITQAVFIILARKAAGLRRGTVLSGWLYQTTRLTSANVVKGEIRRQRREQEAYMQSTLNEPDTAAWEQIAPLLDDAMGRLGETDRDAVVLHFFENKTAAEVAVALKLTEAAAHKRVSRALEKLRKFFTKRGVSSTTAIIAGAISANSVQAAPVTLTKPVTAVAMAKGATASTSTLTLINGALKIMAWAKVKTAVIVGAGVLLAAGTTTVAITKFEASRAGNPDSWRTSNLNSQTLDQLPSQVRILPTTFPAGSRRGIRGSGNGMNRKMAGLGFQVSAIFAAAFGRNDARIVFNGTEPADRYDFICTLLGGQGEALQKELKKQLGLEGRLEMRETDVLLLTVKYPNAPGLKPSVVSPTSRSSFQGNRGHLSGVNVALQNLSNDLEQRLDLPVIDQTGLANRRFDFELAWDQSDPLLNIDGLKRSLLDQLGLELVPARESIEVVVVDKVDN